MVKNYNSDNDVSDTDDYDVVDLDNDEIMVRFYFLNLNFLIYINIFYS